MDQAGDRTADLADFHIGRRIATHHDRAFLGAGGRIVLRDAGAVLRDQPFRDRHDLGRRAIVAVEDVQQRVGMTALELERVAHIRRPEREQRLVVVTDRPELHAARAEMLDQAMLAGIDVLILVDEQVVDRARDRAPVGRMVGDRLQEQRHHVGEIDGAGFPQRRLIDGEELRGAMARLVVLGRGPSGSGPRRASAPSRPR